MDDGIRRTVTHAEIQRIVSQGSGAGDEVVLEYLTEVAESYSFAEAFAVMTLVDTPDVFD